jgi:restriction system protein
MPIPDYQTLMLPLLRILGDQREHHVRDLRNQLAQEFNLTEEERAILLPGGGARLFDNRVGWTTTYLHNAGLIENVRRAVWRITPRGIQVLAERPPRIDANYLDRFPEFLEFRYGHREPGAPRQPQPRDVVEMDTPDEVLESAHRKLKDKLATELLETIKKGSPAFFERLVVDLLLKMGYGGSRQEAGEAIGRSGDEGIDGIIKEDRLGLDIIYIQAKRWSSVVGRPELQRFAGALHGQRARKGIFITTSSFTREAVEYAGQIDTKIILIDGAKLSELMIEHGVGVTTVASYEVKRIDSDYFEEE